MSLRDHIASADLLSELEGLAGELACQDALVSHELGESDGPMLDVVDLDAVGELESRLAAAATRLASLPGANPVEQLCAETVRAELWLRTVGRPASSRLRRVPYWYLEHLGDAYRQASLAEQVAPGDAYRQASLAEQVAPGDAYRQASLVEQVAPGDAYRQASLVEQVAPGDAYRQGSLAEQVAPGDAYRQASLAGQVAPGGDSLLAGRLRATPDFLARAAANLCPREIPEAFIAPTLTAGEGLLRLLDDLGAASGAPGGPGEGELAAARASVASFVDLVGSLDPGAAASGWQVGTERFDAMLANSYRLAVTCDELYEQGREGIEAQRRALELLAEKEGGGRSWLELLDEARQDSPSAERLLDAYADEVRLARDHVVAARIVTLPEGETCSVESVPQYLRHGLPMGMMEVVRPFGPGRASTLLITPVDTSAADGGAGHLAESNRAFLRSIVGHETYPGHHVQGVHHKLAVSGLVACALHRNPTFVEGWGLYVEDVLHESGHFDSLASRLMRRRNALWRQARLVVDAGMHSYRITPDEAVELMERECVMSRHMAAGEVKRYLRHDNPTYPSAYVLGRERFSSLSSWWRATVPSASLGELHDLVLSLGSPPIGLVTPELLAALRELATDGRQGGEGRA